MDIIFRTACSSGKQSRNKVSKTQFCGKDSKKHLKHKSVHLRKHNRQLFQSGSLNFLNLDLLHSIHMFYLLCILHAEKSHVQRLCHRFLLVKILYPELRLNFYEESR